MSESARPFGKSKLVGGKGNFLMACSRGEKGPMHVGICSIYIYVHDNMYIYIYCETYIYLMNLDDEYTLICSPSSLPKAIIASLGTRALLQPASGNPLGQTPFPRNVIQVCSTHRMEMEMETLQPFAFHVYPGCVHVKPTSCLLRCLKPE